MVSKTNAVAWIIIIVVFFSILLVIFTMPSLESEKSKCRKFREKSKGADCFASLALKYNSTEICDDAYRYGGDLASNICYIKIAKELNNVDLCQNVSRFQESVENSQEACYAYFAIKDRNPELCNELNDSMYYPSSIIDSLDMCYNNVAIGLNDESICYNIITTKTKITCLAYITKDPSVCGRVCEFIMERGRECLGVEVNTLTFWCQQAIEEAQEGS